MATFAQSFKPAHNDAGVFPLAAGGPQAINATSTVQNYPLGTRIIAKDPVLGEAEFVYCVGVANTAAGNVVAIAADFTTIRAAGGTAVGPVGVAMSACVANNYGWYCVKGRCVVTIAADIAAAVPAYLAAAGVTDDTVAATKQLVGMGLAIGLNAGGSDIVGTTDTTAANTTIALLHYPVAVVAV
jgi:hypothetical protein